MLKEVRRVESRASAMGDDLQHSWVDAQTHGGGGFGAADDPRDQKPVVDTLVYTVSDEEVLEHSPEQDREEVERLAQRVRQHADRRLFEVVCAEGFAGKHWRQMSDDLIQYGRAVMNAWMRTGYIFAKANAIGRPLRHTSTETLELARDSDLRQELELETVARALNNFRDQAMAGKGWHPDGGANLTTFFVGACAQAFHNEFRRWSTYERRWGPNRSTDPQDLVDHGGQLAEVQRGPHMFADPARAAADKDHLHRVLKELTDVERAIVVMTDDGYSQEEIGEALDISERAVEGRLYRLRQKDIRIGRGE
jgi:DNA-directed RNA polymerase specialized sigma24 family protein